jgi:hypothetical protein
MEFKFQLSDVFYIRTQIRHGVHFYVVIDIIGNISMRTIFAIMIKFAFSFISIIAFLKFKNQSKFYIKRFKQ